MNTSNSKTVADSAGTDNSLFLSPKYQEVRRLVFEYLYRRPIAIVPGDIRYNPPIKYHGQNVSKIFSYQWDHKRQKQYETQNLPQYNTEYSETCAVTWTSLPTQGQLTSIQSGDITIDENSGKRRLTCYRDADWNLTVFPFLLKRGENDFLIINRARTAITAIHGLALLRACKQLRDEGTDTLYSSNTFVFNTCGEAPFTHRFGFHANNVLETSSEYIPGLLYDDGTPMPLWMTKRAVNKIFDHKFKHTKFIKEDPFTRFLAAIGRVNACKLYNIKFELRWKTADSRYVQGPLGFDTLLRVYTPIFQYALPNLQEIILHQLPGGSTWQSDLFNTAGKTDEERIFVAVETLVNSLKKLTSLCLGSYHEAPAFFSKGEDRQWGKSIKLEGVVHQRLLDRWAGEERRTKEKAEYEERQARSEDRFRAAEASYNSRLEAARVAAHSGRAGGVTRGRK